MPNNNEQQYEPLTFDAIKIGLASPEKILEWSRGEVTKPETINYRTLKPEKDGLFCERIFGPSKDWECHCGKYKKIRYKGVVCDRCGVEVTKASVRRERMGHIALAAPVSHIWYFKGIPSRMGLILDISPRTLERVLYFASYIVLDKGETNLAYKQVLSEAEYQEAKEKYEQVFSRFISSLEDNTFKKLVLSRNYTQALEGDFSPLTAFIRACNNYPRMMISLCHTPQTGTWIGSTPEIILSGQDTEWHTVALAGTMPMQGEIMPTEWSEKNQNEQAFVSEYIRQTVKRFGNKLKEKGPYTARAGQLVHLKTDFHFELKDTAHLGDILQELHPTPAVCGLPKEEAYHFILNNEGYNRAYYTGIIGWLDPQGETTLYVNLRCMNITDKTATFYAGGGILPSSTVETEWEETQQKMNTMRNIL